MPFFCFIDTNSIKNSSSIGALSGRMKKKVTTQVMVMVVLFNFHMHIAKTINMNRVLYISAGSSL